MEPLELAFTVGCPPAHAFAVWTERTSLWWPKSHSVSADPRADGDVRAARGRPRLRAHPGRRGARLGRGPQWDPPRRLAYRWHLRQDREDATRVEISFAPAGDGTAVTIVHSDWQRLGQQRDEAHGPSAASRGWAMSC